jgi:NAD(P)-dependent dehydrogenase (short-subunit alcohol dehydrogenase family)
MELENTIAIVTGSVSGLGAATASALALRGVHVVGLDLPQAISSAEAERRASHAHMISCTWWPTPTPTPDRSDGPTSSSCWRAPCDGHSRYRRHPRAGRTDARLVAFMNETAIADKPVAAVCPAAWVLAEADVVRDRTVTSSRSVRTDLVNAGATWVDEEVVVDGPLITSRRPADLDAFCDQILASLA